MFICGVFSLLDRMFQASLRQAARLDPGARSASTRRWSTNDRPVPAVPGDGARGRGRVGVRRTARRPSKLLMSVRRDQPRAAARALMGAGRALNDGRAQASPSLGCRRARPARRCRSSGSRRSRRRCRTRDFRSSTSTTPSSQFTGFDARRAARPRPRSSCSTRKTAPPTARSAGCLARDGRTRRRAGAERGTPDRRRAASARWYLRSRRVLRGRAAAGRSTSPSSGHDQRARCARARRPLGARARRLVRPQPGRHGAASTTAACWFAPTPPSTRWRGSVPVSLADGDADLARACSPGAKGGALRDAAARLAADRVAGLDHGRRRIAAAPARDRPLLHAGRRRAPLHGDRRGSQRRRGARPGADPDQRYDGHRRRRHRHLPRSRRAGCGQSAAGAAARRRRCCRTSSREHRRARVDSASTSGCSGR